MTTNADAIAALVSSKRTLQGQCDAASVDTLRQLTGSIDVISSEIGALAASALNNAAYVPATNPFKKTTNEAQAFLAVLSKLKATFGAAGAVASALDSVINLVTKLSL